MKRSVIERNGRVGVVVATSASLNAKDVLVRRSVTTDEGNWGVGIFVEAAELRLNRALLDSNLRSGLRVDERPELGPAPSATLTDVIVRNTEPRPEDGILGNGIKVTSPDASSDEARARFSGDRLLLEGNHGSAFASNNAIVGVRDITVRGTRRSDGDSDGGTGYLVSGGEVEITRSEFVDNQEAGVLIDTPGSRVVLHDFVVEDTQTRDSPRIGGRGISAVPGTSLEIYRASVARNHEAAIALDGPSDLWLEDVTVEDTLTRPDDGLFGVALSVQSTDVRGSRVRLARSHQVAAWVGRHSTMSLVDLTVEDAFPQACADEGCPAFGIGVGAYQQSRLDLQRFSVNGAELCGVQIAAQGELDLDDGRLPAIRSAHA